MRAFLNKLWSLRRAIALYGSLIALGGFAGHFLVDVAVPEVRPMNEPMLHRIIMTALIVFVLAAAIPFVPGAEIGFALLLIFGGQAAPVVYVGMVSALMLTYCIARFVPLSTVSRAARWLGLRRIATLADQLADSPVDQRAEAAMVRLNGRFAKALLKNRYVLLAVFLNTPGNSALGGGGGLAFAAGVSGLYRFWPYLISVLIAVAPFPVAFALMGG